MYEVNSDSPDFAPAREALVRTLRVTAAAAADYLLSLRATQFERLAEGVRIAKNQEHEAALVRVALAETMAEDALVKAAEAKSAIGRLPSDHSVEGLAAALVTQTEALALVAKSDAAAARALLAALASAEPVEPGPTPAAAGAEEIVDDNHPEPSETAAAGSDEPDEPAA